MLGRWGAHTEACSLLKNVRTQTACTRTQPSYTAHARAATASTMADNFQMTEEEERNFSKMLSTEEGAKLFAEYLREISDPAGRAEMEEQIRRAEAAAASGGDEARFNVMQPPPGKALVRPAPGFVIKVKKTSDASRVPKAFVNVVATHAIDPPVFKGPAITLPHMVSGVRYVRDNADVPTMTVDVAFHPQALALSRAVERAAGTYRPDDKTKVLYEHLQEVALDAASKQISASLGKGSVSISRESTTVLEKTRYMRGDKVEHMSVPVEIAAKAQAAGDETAFVPTAGTGAAAKAGAAAAAKTAAASAAGKAPATEAAKPSMVTAAKHATTVKTGASAAAAPPAPAPAPAPVPSPAPAPAAPADPSKTLAIISAAGEPSGWALGPACTVTHRGVVALSPDAVPGDDAAGAAVMSTRPKSLVMRVAFYPSHAVTVGDLELDVTTQEVALQSKRVYSMPAAAEAGRLGWSVEAHPRGGAAAPPASLRYVLRRGLPFPVDHERGSAKFDKSKGVLTLELPVLPPSAAELAATVAVPPPLPAPAPAPAPQETATSAPEPAPSTAAAHAPTPAAAEPAEAAHSRWVKGAVAAPTVQTPAPAPEPQLPALEKVPPPAVEPAPVVAPAVEAAVSAPEPAPAAPAPEPEPVAAPAPPPSPAPVAVAAPMAVPEPAPAPVVEAAATTTYTVVETPTSTPALSKVPHRFKAVPVPPAAAATPAASGGAVSVILDIPHIVKPTDAAAMAAVAAHRAKAAASTAVQVVSGGLSLAFPAAAVDRRVAVLTVYTRAVPECLPAYAKAAEQFGGLVALDVGTAVPVADGGDIHALAWRVRLGGDVDPAACTADVADHNAVLVLGALAATPAVGWSKAFLPMPASPSSRPGSRRGSTDAAFAPATVAAPAPVVAAPEQKAPTPAALAPSPAMAAATVEDGVRVSSSAPASAKQEQVVPEKEAEDEGVYELVPGGRGFDVTKKPAPAPAPAPVRKHVAAPAPAPKPAPAPAAAPKPAPAPAPPAAAPPSDRVQELLRAAALDID